MFGVFVAQCFVAIILMGKSELIVLLCLSSWCLGAVIVLWLFLTVSLVGLQCVAVVFPYNTHFLFRPMHCDIPPQIMISDP